MAIIYSDDFDGSNTPNFSGRTLNNALGGAAAATWVIAQNSWAIASNEAVSDGYAAMALVSAPTANKLRARIRTAASNNRSSLVANAASDGTGPAVIVYLSGGNDSITIREMFSGDLGGNDKVNAALSVSNDTEYVFELERDGNEYTARVYESDGTTLVGSVAYDFGGTSFSGTHWGITNYTGDNIYALGAIFYEPDAPPSGNALLLQLMQHGQFTGGFL